jgi:type IV secretory pathway component VirB8
MYANPWCIQLAVVMPLSPQSKYILAFHYSEDKYAVVESVSSSMCNSGTLPENELQ